MDSPPAPPRPLAAAHRPIQPRSPCGGSAGRRPPRVKLGGGTAAVDERREEVTARLCEGVLSTAVRASGDVPPLEESGLWGIQGGKECLRPLVCIKRVEEEADGEEASSLPAVGMAPTSAEGQSAGGLPSDHVDSGEIPPEIELNAISTQPTQSSAQPSVTGAGTSEIPSRCDDPPAVAASHMFQDTTPERERPAAHRSASTARRRLFSPRDPGALSFKCPRGSSQASPPL